MLICQNKVEETEIMGGFVCVLVRQSVLLIVVLALPLVLFDFLLSQRKRKKTDIVAGILFS